MDSLPSNEHVFPRAIGGRITTDRVCKPCNSILGSRVDVALTDFFPIRMRRAKLSLAGNSGRVPPWYEMFLGKAKLVGQDAEQVHITFNKETGHLDTRQLKHVSESVTPDGRKMLQITIDARDRDQIPMILAREHKRRGLPPLSEEQIASQLESSTVNKVDQPLIQTSFQISFAFLRHATMKIIYELAFLWLGDLYLDDPVAADLRKAILSPAPGASDNIAGYVGWAEDCTGFKNWLPHEAHHLAHASVVEGNIIISIRVFDIWAACIIVSREAGRYLKSNTDREKLRFVAIDAASGKTIDTPLDQELKRLAKAMTTFRRTPPFADPL